MKFVDKDEWIRSILLIALLLVLAILIAQSRRNCEVPGSTWVPCIWGKALGPPKSLNGTVVSHRLRCCIWT